MFVRPVCFFAHHGKPHFYTSLMLTISADEMQRDLPAYLKLVQGGETLLITQANEPVAEVVMATTNKQPRPFDLAQAISSCPTISMRRCQTIF